MDFKRFQGSIFQREVDSVYFYLLLILILGAALRWYGFNHPHMHSFDEGVYARLGLQLSKNVTDYNTQALYREAINSGRSLPVHYNAPLFCHPPLYPFLISLLYRIFPPFFEIAHWISFLLGVTTIIITFFLAQLLFRDNRIAVSSAFILAIDPNHIICSEKIWMEATLVFFMSLALLFFVLGVQKGGRFFILCGFTSGFAIVTKMPGATVLIAFFLFGLFMKRELFRNKSYWSIFFIAFLMYLPWVIWQLRIYRSALIQSDIFPNHGFFYLSRYILTIVLSLLIFILVYRKFIAYQVSNGKSDFLTSRIFWFFLVSAVLIIIFALPYKHVKFRNFLDLFYLPINGWNSIAIGEHWYFYFGRLLELSPLSIFSYLSLIFYFEKRESVGLLIFFIGLIVSFYILWGNYQSRYISPIMPLLSILSGFFFFESFRRIARKQSLSAHICNYFFVCAACLLILKTIAVVFGVSLPNLTCYY
jgi:4-amino-4-deoxy-L-arabinose transferase-like glycosyltransferase